MNIYHKVIAILDASVGGPDAPVGFPHTGFWRGLTRDEFVAKKVLGLPLVTVGDGESSTLVKALKGEAPFGFDIGTPNADFNRMPSGLDPVSNDDIALIEKWIDDGCPEEEVTGPTALVWRKTNAPVASSRTDDCWFIDPQTGWAVNSDGKIIKTTDGGDSWDVQHSAPGLYLRCVGFANANRGWVGTLSPSRRVLHTEDGGQTWSPVSNLPANAPVKVCGLSVVSDQIVYGSGTNDPRDVPRMFKTTDGGVTWSTWDMSPHASVLIDCFFSDASHGWVVGGKADEPTPTTRDKLKPVVLETTDGGTTWTNRLAGQEDSFPFGEWGWKIQFLDKNLGLVSLENFTRAAILKTMDGGVSWERLTVSDPQGNVNLEGVGFVDEQNGWVGGWGPGGFGGSPSSPQGFSSATADGGITWTNANHIGLFINRFRFFGTPVFVGYASGDTVYKYSSDPVPTTSATSLRVAHDPARALLPDVQLTGEAGSVPIRMHIPPGTKRLSLLVWDRFGEQVGCILDEIHPQNGSRTWVWDTNNAYGQPVTPGDYIVRIVADDETASSRLKIDDTRKTVTAAISRRSIPRRMPFATAKQSRFATLDTLVKAADHDIDWLRDALQTAIQLELATLPPYLLASWSIMSGSEPVAATIKQIAKEEMLHFGLACNMLTAIRGTPLIADPAVVPSYPGPLPWGIRPGLEVPLRKLDRQQAEVFMQIEFPQYGPIAAAVNVSPTTIGEFYASILTAFQDLAPSLSIDRQMEGLLGLFKIDSLDKVKQAITLINRQGEGSTTSPEEMLGELAHYYQFGEIYHGKRYVANEQGQWGYNGPDLLLPDVYDIADIPPGGYQQADVNDPQTRELISRFDRDYSRMLRSLQAAWTSGDASSLGLSVSQMFQMRTTARELIMKQRQDSKHYGPSFRYVPET